MADPGGREIGRVRVRVLPGTDAFGRSLSRYLDRVERTSVVRIPAVLDAAGLAADARRVADTAERAAAVTVAAELDDATVQTRWRELVARLSGDTVHLSVEVDKRALDQARAIGAAFGRVAGTTLSIGNAAGAAQSLIGIASAAVSASGALLLLPAAGAAAAATIATLVLGFQGFGDALSSLDDPAAFADALAKLAPSARETAQAVKDLQPSFAGLRLDVQQRLFAGMGQEVTRLGGSYLPVLRSGLGGIASELNTGARGFSAFLTSSQSLSDTGAILDNVRDSLARLNPAGVAVAQAFRDIAAVGSEFLPQLASSLAASAQRFADFIAQARQSGQLKTWIGEGLSTLSQMWQLLRNIGSIVRTVFGALNDGGGFLAFLVDATGQLSAFLKSAEGTEVLSKLADFLAAAGEAASGVFGAALTELAPALINLLPALSQFATQIGGALVLGLQLAGPLLAQLSSFLAQNAGWLGPLVIGLGTLAAVAGPLASALSFVVTSVRAVTMAFNLMKVAFATNPFTAIALAIVTLVVLVVTNWDAIKAKTIEIWRAVSDWVGARVRDVLDVVGWIGQLPGRVLGWFRGVRDGAVNTLGDMLAWLRGLPGRIIDALGDLGSLLLQTGRNIISGLLNGLREAASAVGRFLLNLVKDAVGDVLSWLGIASPSRRMHQIGAFTAEGFARGIADATPLAARAADRLANAATFDPVRADFDTTAAGAGAGVTVNQSITPHPDQSPWSIATAANRQIGYALRTGGLP
ncbi:hypothetical protein V5P93_000417 [Actinokineospora auranticolor]|uniref:Phage-related protein n=1 Tax=Actinokineospora auranticolor TaxID=155976 RepID=A0A2S6GE64_9PSEU|nr:hypothetical protein [Actinokineospora auranticolor]PPK63528.1 hypothetical protein CLV40_12755 [Actinokineospora auranticolor]